MHPELVVAVAAPHGNKQQTAEQPGPGTFLVPAVRLFRPTLGTLHDTNLIDASKKKAGGLLREGAEISREIVGEKISSVVVFEHLPAAFL
jgi:hypothetical protein